MRTSCRSSTGYWQWPRRWAMWRRKHIEDKELQRKEMSLGPGPDAYFNAVRSGLWNAYLAASVVGSGLVSTSEVGVMGNAGTALKLLSGAVPFVGGLAGFADHRVGTRCGGGQVHLRRRKEKTAGERWSEIAESGAVEDHHPVTHERLKEFAAVQDEKHREHDANYSRLGRQWTARKRAKKRRR
eukprot:g3591.t1